MKRYVALDENNFIISTTDIKFSQNHQEIFDFPNDFDFSKQENYQVINGKLVKNAKPETHPEMQIAELKRNLADTDYQAIKYAEGWLTDQEYAPIKAQRQLWRDRINNLQNCTKNYEEVSE